MAICAWCTVFDNAAKSYEIDDRMILTGTKRNCQEPRVEVQCKKTYMEWSACKVKRGHRKYVFLQTRMDSTAFLQSHLICLRVRFVFILMEWILKMPVTEKETSLLTFWQNFIIYFLKAQAFNTNMRDLKRLRNLTQQSVHSHLKSATFQILPISSISARMASLSLSDRLLHIWERKPSSVACVEDEANSWIHLLRHWWPSPLSPQSGGPCTPSRVLCIPGAWQRDMPTTWPKAHCLHPFLPDPLVGLSALTIKAKLFHLCFCWKLELC